MRGVRRSAVVAAAVLALTGGCAAPALPGSTACVRYPTPPGISVGATLIPKPPSPRANAAKLKVGLADDPGGRGDGSVSGTAAAGLDRAGTGLGLANTRELAAATGEGDAAAAARLDQLVTGGYNPVIAVGPAYADAVRSVATAHPAVRFAIVDDDSVVLPNVTPLVFAEEQSAFLVGVAAAMKSTTCHVGFVGGARTRERQKYEAGYVQGARFVAPDVEVDISYVNPGGDDSGDPGRATALARAQYAGGADVVFAAAGASGQGVFRAAQAAGRLAIGVDSDRYLDPGGRGLEPVIVTSALKHLDTAVYDYIAAVAAGDLAPLPARFDLGDGGVGYARSGGRVDDIDGYLQSYAVAIAGGTIKVDTTPSS